MSGISISSLAGVVGAALQSAVDRSKAMPAVVGDITVNFAKVATSSASYTSGDTKLSALNDGFSPANSRDQSQGIYGNWAHIEPRRPNFPMYVGSVLPGGSIARRLRF